MESLPTMIAATDAYFSYVFADPELAHIFRSINKHTLKRHVALLLNMVVATNDLLTPEHLQMLECVHIKVIERWDVTRDHCDRMIDHLIRATEEIGVEPEVIERLLQRIVPVREVFPIEASGKVHPHGCMCFRCNTR
jgi:truncated hemoglobin YjbI